MKGAASMVLPAIAAFTVVEKSQRQSDSLLIMTTRPVLPYILIVLSSALLILLLVNKLHSHFEVINRSERTMPFMLGNHPGYRFSFFKGSVDLGPNQLSYLPVRREPIAERRAFPV
jgi:hypothetical protein